MSAQTTTRSVTQDPAPIEKKQIRATTTQFPEAQVRHRFQDSSRLLRDHLRASEISSAYLQRVETESMEDRERAGVLRHG